MGGGLQNGDGLSLRAARKGDLDAITHIIKAGFPDDPGCNYKFPCRYQHPDDFWYWTRLEYEEYLDQPEKFAVLVVTTPAAEQGEAANGPADEPIAIGVWDIAVETNSTGGDRGIHERRDANPKHMRVYADAITRGFSKYFTAYGKEQLHLWMLVTRPDYRQLGAGTQLCNWGQRESEKRGGWMLTVMASPMGRSLYEHLGYKLVGAEWAWAEGENKNVEIYVMEKKGMKQIL